MIARYLRWLRREKRCVVGGDAFVLLLGREIQDVRDILDLAEAAGLGECAVAPDEVF